MRAETSPGWSPIDVYSDPVPQPGQRWHGQHRSPSQLAADVTDPADHGYQAPPLAVTAALPRPTMWPETCRTAEEIVALFEVMLAGESREVNRKSRQARALGLIDLLDWLAGFEGETWQQRWIAGGLNDQQVTWTDLAADTRAGNATSYARSILIGGVGGLISLSVIRPSYAWLYAFRSKPTLSEFREARDPEGFTELSKLCSALPGYNVFQQESAFKTLARILIHNGGKIADITIEDCREAYAAQLAYSSSTSSLWYWMLLHGGQLGPTAPRHAQALTLGGQRSITELVDGYRVQAPAVRQLLIDYLQERRATVDYSTVVRLAAVLVLLFWRDLEIHEPGIESLDLSDEVARRWKDRLRVVAYGRHRVGRQREDPNAILMTVRAFYDDLSHWATQDPPRWGPWVAPNPIRARDLIGQNKQKSRMRARMHQRTRELAPLVGPLAVSADRQRLHATALLAAGRDALDGEQFTVDDETLTRAVMITDPAKGGRGRPGMIWAYQSDGVRRNLIGEEERTFWGWAVIEVLRHTGIRVEELTELTHRSFVAYTLPSTGEIIPLLQVTPSKTDKERLLVVSPELGEVLATIIDRVRAGADQVPLIIRCDHSERVNSAPLPFLFQWRYGLINSMISEARAGRLMDLIVHASGLSHTDGTPAHFTPHDFRRIFATEAVAAGLPVHIAAKVLGHESLNTTQGYVAVYDHDVIEHHRAFIARRRQQRPSAEYRDVTAAEWDEFLAHFELRKVELGTCGRAYATPCIHEHACVRCPLLRPDPNQLGRLQEIRTNLVARIDEANLKGWAGELEGLHISLAAADHKLDHMRRNVTVAVAAPTTKRSR